ncbi:hypothetical protein C9374_013840 [Naegleria lovaniensis]|uniref:F-box domain-containing protein n=1 Tax=Naegleria lovaniensis TaxID=51637 RepID=A0AA88GYA8_NAELO|nr:uncharacterized protein C9374_013840 [Naegleria lovaniensis]KAG2389280.1 hypothetical protein C9374_013840 [Naegleria lovaniensis]
MIETTNNEALMIHTPNMWEELPLEILNYILEYLDPRNLVNLMCVSSQIRLMAIKFLLMGLGEKEYMNERLRNMNKPNSNLLIPNELGGNSLISFLDVLLSEQKNDEDTQQLFLPRINLSIFSAPTLWSTLNKLESVIEKYHVIELVLNLHESDDVIRWLNKTLSKNSMKTITRLTVMYPSKRGFYHDPKRDELVLPNNRPLKVLNGFFVTSEKSLQNLCLNRELCLSLQVLTISCSYLFHFVDKHFNLLDHALRTVLKSMPNLTTLYFELSTQSRISVDDEMVQLLESTKLKVFRIESSQSIFLQKLTEKSLATCLPHIEELHLNVNFNGPSSSYSHTATTPVYHNEALEAFFPPRPLKYLFYCHSAATGALVMKIPQIETLFIYTQYSAKGDDFPSLKVQRLIVKGYHDYLKEICLTDLFPYTREIVFYDSTVKCSTICNPKRGAKNALESVTLEHCSLDITDSNQIAALISQLRSFKAWKTVFYSNQISNDPTVVTIEKQQRISALQERRKTIEKVCDAQLQTLIVKDCQSFYDFFLIAILSLNMPHLKRIRLENSYSVSEDELQILFESIRGANLMSSLIIGPKFKNNLIMEYLEMIHCFDINSNTHDILKNNDIQLAFNGPCITCELFNLLSNEMLEQISVISLPDAMLECDKFTEILDRLNPNKLKKLQINFGNSGPTLEFFKHLKRFSMLEQVYISGKAKPTSDSEHELFKPFLCQDILHEMAKLTIFFFDCPDWCKFSTVEVELLKKQLRSLNRSAPKLLLPFDNVNSDYSMDPNKKKQTTTWSGSFCEIQ